MSNFPISNAAENLASIDVLIVEDDPVTRALLDRLMKKRGHNTVPCESAEEALTRLMERFYPIILLDVQLPGISGLELLPPTPVPARRGPVLHPRRDRQRPSRRSARHPRCGCERLRREALRAGLSERPPHRRREASEGDRRPKATRARVEISSHPRPTHQAAQSQPTRACARSCGPGFSGRSSRRGSLPRPRQLQSRQ